MTKAPGAGEGEREGEKERRRGRKKESDFSAGILETAKQWHLIFLHTPSEFLMAKSITRLTLSAGYSKNKTHFTVHAALWCAGINVVDM